MKKLSISRGFTLIELLVVVAIIATLASVILTSLGTARNKAKDARVISDATQVRNLLEAGVAANATYPDLGINMVYASVAGSVNMLPLLNDISIQNSGAVVTAPGALPGVFSAVTGLVVATNGAGAAGAGVAPYAIYAKLPSYSTATYFCVDSGGGTNAAATAAQAVVANTKCP